MPQLGRWSELCRRLRRWRRLQRVWNTLGNVLKDRAKGGTKEFRDRLARLDPMPLPKARKARLRPPEEPEEDAWEVDSVESLAFA